MRVLRANTSGNRFYFLLCRGVRGIDQFAYALATIMIAHNAIKGDHRTHGIGDDICTRLRRSIFNRFLHHQCCDDLACLLMHIGWVKSRIVISGHYFLPSW